jgi:hypothetical protein
MRRLIDVEASPDAAPLTLNCPQTGLVATKTARPILGEVEAKPATATILGPETGQIRRNLIASRWLWCKGRSVTMRPGQATTLLGRSDWNEREIGAWDVEAAYTDTAVYVQRLTTRERVTVPLNGRMETHAPLGLSSWMRAEWPRGCLLRWRASALIGWPDSKAAEDSPVLAWRVSPGEYSNVGEGGWPGVDRAQASAALQATDRVITGDKKPLPKFALCLRDPASVAWLEERVTRLGMAVTQTRGGAWLVTGRVNLARAAGVKLKGYAYPLAECDVLEVDDAKGVAIARAVYTAGEALRAASDVEERRQIAKSMRLKGARV